MEGSFCGIIYHVLDNGNGGLTNMKYQCPYCESFDIHRNEKGEVICFDCFSICSWEMELDTRLSKKNELIPPHFPEHLERSSRDKRKRYKSYVSDNVKIMRDVV